MAEAYVSGTLPEAELASLEERLAKDVSFADSFRESVNLLMSLNGSKKHRDFRSMVQSFEAPAAVSEEVTPKPSRVISLQKHYFRTAAMAAGIAIVTSLSTFWLIRHNTNKIASQYSLLRKDLEKYKRSQNQLINNINSSNQKTTPAEPVRYTGTGFALSNDGYLVTNYHVAEGADSIYIQSRDGQYYKATVMVVNPATDLAILKVDDKTFRFGKGDVPYSFSAVKKGLSTSVYTLGYPQDEIVYSEGYISAINGYEGDSSQYMLKIPAEPGQSGAPVLDGNGNIVAIVTGKETESEGTTYAVSSRTLLQLIHDMPQGSRLRLPKANKLSGMSREQQVEKLQSYTCSVKVYKK